jgi:hypothetical protein
MKSILPLLFVSLTAAVAMAEIPASYYPRTIFFDDFSGNGFGKRWGHYKSSSVVKDGMLVGITAPESDHSAVDNIVIEPEKDLEVSVKFRYVSDKAQSFNVWFDDKTYKGSHAGHICSVSVSPKNVQISDAKLGNFKNEYYEKKGTKDKPGTLTEEDKAFLKTKTKGFPVTISVGDWHTLVIRTKGDEVEAQVDGKPVGSFKSEGVGHETKTLVSLTTNRVDVTYDDFSIKGAAK